MPEIELTDEVWSELSKGAKEENLTVQQYFDRYILPEMLKLLSEKH